MSVDMDVIAAVFGRQLLPHQQRVVDEFDQLSQRHRTLKFFIAAERTFSTLHPEEQERLRRQLRTMSDYKDVLSERIINF